MKIKLYNRRKTLKQYLVVVTIALCSLTAANATMITCLSATGAVTLGESAAISPAFQCGTLMFSNFQLPNADGDAVGSVNILGAQFNLETGTVSLQLNPNLMGSEDEDLMFEVQAMSGNGVSQLELAVGGNDAQVSEIACSSPIPTTGPTAFLCPTGSDLGRVSEFSGDLSQPVFSSSFPSTSPIYIFKDIQTGSLPGAGVSVVDQSFQDGPAAVVPEPVSLVLLGSGLLGLGLVRRRQNCKS